MLCHLELVVALTLVTPAFGNTWFVGGSGADFTEIQPAIDAAVDGDVILVRAGTYSAFTLDKGLMVRASDAPFAVTLSEPTNVKITGIGAGKRGGISGMTIAHAIPSFGAFTLVEVSACAGEVALEEVTLTIADSLPFGADGCLHITSCNNLSVTGLVAMRGTNISRDGVVRIDGSHVRMADLVVQAGKQLGCESNLDGSIGQAALQVIDSTAIVASASLIAGDGGDGCAVFHAGGGGGRGGAALDATNSVVFIIGRRDPSSGLPDFDWRGGNGGTAAYEPFGCSCYLGDGGDGGSGFRGATGTSSYVAFVGGDGGLGLVAGDPGVPVDGSLNVIDSIPLLALEGSFHPGGAFTLELDVIGSGGVLLVFADHQGELPIFGNPGPPLAAIPFPGGRFVTAFAGHLGSFEHRTLPLVLPGDTALRGLPIHSQYAVLLDAAGIVLSNAATRVIGE